MTTPNIASFSTDTLAFDHLIAGPTPVSARKVTLVSGQNLTRGAILGIITASGKYTLSLSAAADGSQTPDAVLAQDCDASAGDAECLIYERGDFAESALTFGTGQTTAGVREGLRAKGITIVTTTAA